MQNYAPNFAPDFFKNDINQHTYLIKTKCLTIQKNKIKNPSKALFQAIKGFERLEEPNGLDATNLLVIFHLRWNDIFTL